MPVSPDPRHCQNFTVSLPRTRGSSINEANPAQTDAHDGYPAAALIHQHSGPSMIRAIPPMRRLPHGLWLILLVALAACATPVPEYDRAATRFHESVSSPPLLRAFLYRMPKGGDLHNHLSGAAYAEYNIRTGAQRGMCFDPQTAKVSPPPCKKPILPLADAVNDAALTAKLVDAWSDRDFVPVSGVSRHDHFFGTFGLFGGAADNASMAAEVVNRAGRQRMRYIELMISFGGGSVGALVADVTKSTPWTGDMTAFQAALMAGGMAETVRKATAEVDALETDMRRKMRCGTADPGPGCAVVVRWLQQVNRTAPQPRVFAQTLFAALLSQAEPRVAGLNFVAPEDNPVALADYTLHMRMIGHVLQTVPETKVALHAGELTLGLVPPEDLTFHIRQAVEIGRARRIGHGVAIMYEDDAVGLLREMARQRIAVEINLTSNAQILNVDGDRHPFPVYRAAGVPTLISTDDEAVERIDRTHELQRAVQTYRLTWRDLVGLERNTLEYAFVGGASLWADPVAGRMVPACEGASVLSPPPQVCAAFLNGSEKARLQWSLEHDLAAFDRETAGAALRADR